LVEVNLECAGIEGNQVTIKGRVVYCNKRASGEFNCGICFIGKNMEKLKFVSKIGFCSYAKKITVAI
jgi:hypothetical protein